jgi:hypothetical protein
MQEDKKAEAQQALDELFSEHLLPFKLSARRCNPLDLKNTSLVSTIADYV